MKQYFARGIPGAAFPYPRDAVAVLLRFSRLVAQVDASITAACRSGEPQALSVPLAAINACLQKRWMPVQ